MDASIKVMKEKLSKKKASSGCNYDTVVTLALQVTLPILDCNLAINHKFRLPPPTQSDHLHAKIVLRQLWT